MQEARVQSLIVVDQENELVVGVLQIYGAGFDGSGCSSSRGVSRSPEAVRSASLAVA